MLTITQWHEQALATKLDDRSLLLRTSIYKTVHAGGRGHIGSAFSLIEILRVLYDDILRYQPQNPQWIERDLCILSKGHGCLALYALLADKGFFPRHQLNTFCKIDSLLGGHPEPKLPGVEWPTGSLGHGLAVAVGVALANRMKNRENKVFVITGDGEINEGSIWESALSAAKHKLDRLTVMIDYNKQQSYGPTKMVLDLEPLSDKWRSFGFFVFEANGHDIVSLHNTLLASEKEKGKPKVIICHTVKGKGLSIAEDNPKWHHKSKLTKDEIFAMQQAFNLVEN
ncbi:MAG TPA: transketolase [Gammaproteobacteria bacterium]|nr:MAG: transketolase [Gammaproteobacteria bacterium RIFCSPHIGHO2_12_FULL_41_20]HLB43579.1 transketolase [Gammaproteobacteria bacterium]